VVLWKGVLQSLKQVMGKTAAALGFCYWATDPFDNSDYERFIDDYYQILGRLPQTTTAQPAKDIERTKRFLKFSKERNGWIERFSIVTRRCFDEVHEHFTPEELKNVELIPQFNNEASPKAIAGRARKTLEKRKEKNKPFPPNVQENALDLAGGATIACVSGFLISMIDRSVKLIAPCSANDEWPMGYIVFAEDTFTSGEDFQRILEEMIENDMHISLSLEDQIELNPIIRASLSEDLSSLSPFMQKILPKVLEGASVEEIAIFLEEKFGMDPTHTIPMLNSYFQRGYFKEPRKKSRTQSLVC